MSNTSAIQKTEQPLLRSEYNPGIWPDLDNNNYHADSAVGSSGLKEFGECPALYEYKYLSGKYKNDQSKYSMLGSYAHVALLEPELFAQHYDVAPEFAIVNKGKKNEAKKPMNKAHGDWKEFAAEVPAGKIALLHSEYTRASEMAAAIQNHSLAKAMLTGGKAEMSFFATDEATGLPMKSRPDYLVKVSGIGVVLVDYKTTSLSLRTKKQSDHAFGLQRQIQAAHHKRVTELASGNKIAEVFYITQMQEAPYLIRIFRMPEEGLQIGDEQCRMYLDQMADCFKTGKWPDYPHEIEDLIIPNWFHHDFN